MWSTIAAAVKAPPWHRKEVLAVCASDIHLSIRPPLARSDEEDWLDAQAQYLRQANELCHKYRVPFVIAGDVFDKWNSPPELVNMAIAEFCQFTNGVYAVPGQHDLPLHNLDDIKRSAYWTLHEAKAIYNLDNPRTIGGSAKGFTVFPYPWGRRPGDGFDHGPQWSTEQDARTLAVVHAYVYDHKAHAHPGADDDGSVPDKWSKLLKPFSAAVFGDNHNAFNWSDEERELNVVNCGTFMRRHANEENMTPRVCVLLDDMTWWTCELDTSEDVFTPPSDHARVKHALKLLTDSELGAAFDELNDMTTDFADMLRQSIKKIPKAQRKIILESLEGLSS